MNINIAGVYTPSPKQLNVGIHGSVNLEIVSDEGFALARLNGITVRKSKAGSQFLSMPSFKVTGKEGDKWLKHFALFPFGDDSDYNNKQKENLAKLTHEVLRLISQKTDSLNNSSKASTADQQVSTSSEAEPWG